MNRVSLSSFCLILLFSACQSLAPTATKTAALEQEAPSVLFTVGDRHISVDEFKHLYEKNYTQDSTLYTEKSLEEYLDLYVKFKLKVHEAYQTGMHEEQSFKSEFGSYKSQLAEPYLTDREFSEQLLEEAYERLQQEVNASHLLIQVSPAALAADTLAAYKKALALKKKIEGGTDFGTVAAESSEDPSAKTNKGYLGYFTGMQMVYKFESAAYNAPVGKVVGPVRTRYGYHLIEVKDKRPSNGQVKVAHIMIRAAEGADEEVIAAAKEKIDEIHARAIKGEDWTKLARQFSEDQQTRFQGGEMQPFSVGRYPEPFAEAAFSLKQKGDISTPVRTSFGWHIIQLIERISNPSFEEMKGELKQKISKDSRSEVSQKRFLEKLKVENGFVEKSKTLEKATASIDSSLVAGNFDYSAENKLLPKPLFLIGTEAFTVKIFYDYLKTAQQARENIAPTVYARELYNAFVQTSMLDYEKAHLEEKHESYRRLLQEYEEGILLFAIMESQVWNKAIQDEPGLESFHAAHKNDYMWGDRANARIFSVANDSLLTALQQGLESGTFRLQPEKLPRAIAFRHRSSALTEPLQAELAQVVAFMLKNPALNVEMHGDYINREWKGLVEKRFKKITDYFTKSGVDTSRYEIKGIERFAGTLPNGYKQGGRVYFIATAPSVELAQQEWNRSNSLNIQMQEGKYEKGDNPILEKVEWKEGMQTLAQDDRKVLLHIRQVLPSQAKELQETRGQVISDYQEYLEEEWIKSLKEKYAVEVNEEVFQRLIQK